MKFTKGSATLAQASKRPWPLHQEILACHGKAQQSIERITKIRQRCEQETERLRSLLTDPYLRYRCITHVGAAMIGLVTALGGFLRGGYVPFGTDLAGQVTEAIPNCWAE